MDWNIIYHIENHPYDAAERQNRAQRFRLLKAIRNSENNQAKRKRRNRQS